MICNYTAEFLLDDPSVDTLDAVYTADNGYPAALPFIDTAAIQAFLDTIKSDIVSDGKTVDSITYSIVGNTATITVVQSSVVFNGTDWTIAGVADGGNLFRESQCTSCDYGTTFPVLVGTDKLYGTCFAGGCTVALNVDFGDTENMLIALNNQYDAHSTNIVYSFVDIIPGVLIECTILIEGWNFSQVPTKIMKWDGADIGSVADIPMNEANCIEAVIDNCTVLTDCRDHDLGLTQLLRKTIASDTDLLNSLHVVFAHTDFRKDALCNDGETQATIFKDAMRGKLDKCLMLQVTDVGAGFEPIKLCNVTRSLDSIAKSLRMEIGECIALAVSTEALGDIADCSIGNYSLEQLFRLTLRENGDGELSVAIFNGVFNECTLDCADPQVEMLMRSLFWPSATFPGFFLIRTAE